MCFNFFFFSSFRHQTIHEFNRKYECSLCPFTARFSGHLKRHMRTHTGAKPFACPHCSYRSNNLVSITHCKLQLNRMHKTPIFMSATSLSNLINLATHRTLNSISLPFPALRQPNIWRKYQIVILQITITTSSADLSSFLNFRRRIYVSTWYPRTNIRASTSTNASFARTTTSASKLTLPGSLRVIWLTSTRIGFRRVALRLATLRGSMRRRMIRWWRRRKLEVLVNKKGKWWW